MKPIAAALIMIFILAVICAGIIHNATKEPLPISDSASLNLDHMDGGKIPDTLNQ